MAQPEVYLLQEPQAAEPWSWQWLLSHPSLFGWMFGLSLGSLVLTSAHRTRVPAGGALAVDRDAFAEEVTRALAAEPLVTVVREEVTAVPEGGIAILAVGPLVSPDLAAALARCTGRDYLFFFDAIAPVIEADTIDRSICFAASRYGKGTGEDYLTCPLTREDVDTYSRLMELSAAAKDWGAVATNAERYLAVNPLVAQPYRHLAQASEALDRRDDAISACKTLLLLDPPDPAGAHFQLARLLHQSGDATAKRHLLQALEEAPRFRDAHRLLLEMTKTAQQPVEAPLPETKPPEAKPK